MIMMNSISVTLLQISEFRAIQSISTAREELALAQKIVTSGTTSTAIIRFRLSSLGGHYRREADTPLSRTRAKLAPAKAVLRILDRVDPLAKLAAVG